MVKKIIQFKIFFYDVYSKYLIDFVFFICNEIYVCCGINMFNILMILLLWNNIDFNFMF